MNPLDRLEPLIAPLPVGWWPPAPGWWLLAAPVSYTHLTLPTN
ncbi:DUF4381 domain-containing protein, partial [Pseudomonas aeruginosa]|nr:DUF4381 domain-containing protein [Pseudomonas aeruginosa]